MNSPYYNQLLKETDTLKICELLKQDLAWEKGQIDYMIKEGDEMMTRFWIMQIAGLLNEQIKKGEIK